MLRKVLSLGALIVVAVTFGASSAAAKPSNPPKGQANGHFNVDGFSDGRLNHGHSKSDGFSDGA